VHPQRLLHPKRPLLSLAGRCAPNIAKRAGASARNG
jgi:hypothetical protein